MEAAEAHVRAWLRNRDCATKYGLAFSDDPAWEIVLLFYAGLHITQAYLATKGVRFAEATNHGDRKRAIRACTELGGRFRPAYDDLRDLSESVRYDPFYSPRSVDHDAARSHLKIIEQFLVSKLESRVPTAFPRAAKP